MGLTGGIASGKSTISRLLAGLGCLTVDADAIVSGLYRPGQAGHAAIVAHYGASVLRADQTIDRARLAELAFATEASARQLNELIHPLVLKEQDRLRAELPADHADRDLIYVVEATLLIEAGNLDRYDRIVVVTASPDLQLVRALARGMDREDAVRRMSRQLSAAERIAHADYILNNSGDLSEAQRSVQILHGLLQSDLVDKKRGLLKTKTPRQIGGA